MLAPDGAGTHKKPVDDIGLERFRPLASHGGFHATDGEAIREHFDGDGI